MPADSYVVDYTPHEGGGSFAPMPAGTHQLVCVDGVYLGERVDSYQGGPIRIVKKYAFVFQSEDVNPDTNARYEISKEFTISMNEKAALRKFLSAWRGRTYTDEEARGVDISRVVGANGIGTVEHATSQAGRSYGKLLSVAPLMKNMTKLVAESYERAPYWEQRKQEYAAGVAQHRAAHPVAQTVAANGHADPAPVLEEIPF